MILSVYHAGEDIYNQMTDKMMNEQWMGDNVKIKKHRIRVFILILILLCVLYAIYRCICSSGRVLNYVEKKLEFVLVEEIDPEEGGEDGDGPLPWGEFYQKMYQEMYRREMETQAEISRMKNLHDIQNNIYAVPFVRYLTSYSHANKYYRASEWNSVQDRDERYTAYLNDLYERQGMPDDDIYEAKPSYSYLSLQQKGSLQSVFTDYFAIFYPTDIRYGSSDECADMLYTRTEEEDAAVGYLALDIQWKRDMRLEENRLADRGRLYLFAVSGENYAENGLSACDIDLPGIEELLAHEKTVSRVRSVIPEEITWTDCRSFSTSYHDYAHAEGETALRNIAVYLPQMRENENFQWILLIEEFKDGAEDKTGIYECRQDIIDRFVIFPYWYEIKEGDTLWNLARRITGKTHPRAIERTIKTICSDPLNKIENPDVIAPGQRLFLAPHVFLE